MPTDRRVSRFVGAAKSANLSRLTQGRVDALPSCEFPALQREMVLHVRTFSPKQSDITRTWFEIDATDLTLGRLATEVALRLKGKHKPIYSPHVDTGDHIVIINASKVYMETGKAAKTFFFTHSGCCHCHIAIDCHPRLESRFELIDAFQT